MSKKLFSLILAAVMMLTLAVPVFAENAGDWSGATEAADGTVILTMGDTKDPDNNCYPGPAKKNYAPSNVFNDQTFTEGDIVNSFVVGISPSDMLVGEYVTFSVGLNDNSMGGDGYVTETLIMYQKQYDGSVMFTLANEYEWFAPITEDGFYEIVTTYTKDDNNNVTFNCEIKECNGATMGTGDYDNGVFADAYTTRYIWCVGSSKAGKQINVGVPSYTITDNTANDANGTVNIDKTTVEYNGSATVTLTPDAGYEVDKVTVNDVDTEVIDNTVMLNSIKEDKTVNVTFKETTQTVDTFTVTAAPTENGTITFGEFTQPGGPFVADKESMTVVSGGKFYVEILPAEGYKVGDIYENDKLFDKNTCENPDDEAGYKLVFHDITEDTVIKVNFVKIATTPTTPTTPGGSVTVGGGSSSSSDPAQSFWYGVRNEIDDADKGSTITINAEDYNSLPWYVMDAARANGVGLKIEWDGKTIKIPAGKALNEKYRTAYPFEYLAKYNFDKMMAEEIPAVPETGAPVNAVILVAFTLAIAGAGTAIILKRKIK